MRYRILTVKITQQGLSQARQRTRSIGELFGLDTLQCTRFITAVSEIARNAVQYANGGSLAFLFDTDSPHCMAQCVVAEVSDIGPGIPDLPQLLSGLARADGRTPLGILGSRRLVDHLGIREADGGGTVVTIEMALPRHHRVLEADDVNARVEELSRRKAATPVDELEQQNREMLYTLEELRQKQLSLQMADQRKNEFLAMLAHELRNPLLTLNLNLEMLRIKVHTPPELADRRDVMKRQIDQLRGLVEDLLDIARIEQGKVELHKAPAEINRLVREALEMTSAAIQERKHSVEVRPAGYDLWVHGDAARLRQVVGNVLHNAARYTPEQGRIAVVVRSEGGAAVVEISDNGVGIAADLLPQVFGMFVQAEKREGTGGGGLGLGLSLASRLIADHGGSIGVASEGADQGSQFTIRLPLMPGAPG